MERRTPGIGRKPKRVLTRQVHGRRKPDLHKNKRGRGRSQETEDKSRNLSRSQHRPRSQTFRPNKSLSAGQQTSPVGGLEALRDGRPVSGHTDGFA